MLKYDSNILSSFNCQDRFNNCFDDFVGSLINKWVLCAGGAARSIVSNEPINDYDLFFTDISALKQTVKYLKTKGKVIFECPEQKFYSFKYKNVKIQLICNRMYKDVNDLLSSFDFTITQFCTDNYKLYTYYNSLYDYRKKLLRLNKVTYPSATIKRINKYINYGYKPNAAFYSSLVEMIYNHSSDIIDPKLVYID